MKDEKRKTTDIKEMIKIKEELSSNPKKKKTIRNTIAKLKNIDFKTDFFFRKKKGKNKDSAKRNLKEDDLFNQDNRIHLNSDKNIQGIKIGILNQIKTKKKLEIKSKTIREFKYKISEFLQINNFLLISKDNQILKIDENNKETKIVENSESGKIKCFCISKDEKYLFFGNHDYTIKTVTLEKTPKIVLFGKHKNVRQLKISQNGKNLISASSDVFKIWNISEKKQISNFETKLEPKINCLIIVEKSIFFTLNNLIYKQVLKKKKSPKKFGFHKKKIFTIIISNDKKRIISSGTDGNIKIWNKDLIKQIPIIIQNPGNSISSLLLSENDKWLFTGDTAGKVKIWDLKNLREISVLGDHKIVVKKLIFSRNEHFVFSLCGYNVLKKWDVRKNRQIDFFDNSSVVSSLSVSGEFLYSAGNDFSIKIWDLKKDRKVFFETKKKRESKIGVVLGVNGEEIDEELNKDFDEEYIDKEKLENEKTGLPKLQKKPTIPKIEKDGTFKILGKHENLIRCLCLSNSKKRLFSGSKDNSIKIWDLQNQVFLEILGHHQKEITCLCISKTDKNLFSGSCDKTIKIWDLEKKINIAILQNHQNFIRCLSLSKDEKYLFSGSWDKTIKIWDLEKNEFLQDLGKHEDYVSCLAVSKNGDFLVSGSKDNCIKIWDLNFFKEIGVLSKSKYDVNCLIFSKNGDFLFSAHSDKTVKIWDLRSFREIGILGKHEDNIICLEISENSDIIFSGSKDGIIKVWDLKKILFNEKLFVKSTILKNEDFGLDEDYFLEKIKSFENCLDYMFFLRLYYNPILICVLFQFSKALEFILRKDLFFYYQTNFYQFSPLILAFRIKNIDIIKILLEHLKKPENTFSLTYEEIYFLLEHENPLIDDFLSFLPNKIKKFHNKNQYIPPQTNIKDTDLIYIDQNKFCNFHFSSWSKKKNEKYLIKKKKKKSKKNSNYLQKSQNQIQSLKNLFYRTRA